MKDKQASLSHHTFHKNLFHFHLSFSMFTSMYSVVSSQYRKITTGKYLSYTTFCPFPIQHRQTEGKSACQSNRTENLFSIVSVLTATAKTAEKNKQKIISNPETVLLLPQRSLKEKKKPAVILRWVMCKLYWNHLTQLLHDLLWNDKEKRALW